MTDQITPYAGFGLGMRPPHYASFLDCEAEIDFVEVISENFMVAGGRPLNVIDRVRQRYDVILHGVSMSLGSAGGIRPGYLARLKTLVDRVQPLWVSDHLCWTGMAGFNSHDLLPLPYTAEAMDRVCDSIDEAQSALGRAMLIENPSSYLTFAGEEMTEWQFLSEMTRRTGCSLLLDVNNVFVSASNHGFDAEVYIQSLPRDAVRQIHLAGHTAGRDGLLIDTHDQPVPDGVWALYDLAVRRFGPLAVMIERDDNIPPLQDLLAELETARRMTAMSTAGAA